MIPAESISYLAKVILLKYIHCKRGIRFGIGIFPHWDRITRKGYPVLAAEIVAYDFLPEVDGGLGMGSSWVEIQAWAPIPLQDRRKSGYRKYSWRVPEQEYVGD